MKKHMLVIEDNEQNMYLMSFLLERSGFVVHRATNGKEGIRLANEKKPHAILLDIQLPELDGYRVAQEIRKSPSLRNMPIIAVTSYAMPGDKERILAAGASGYIEKPIDPDTFVFQLMEFMTSPNKKKGARP
jgi:two-component system cell cycle response regulator DivK